MAIENEIQRIRAIFKDQDAHVNLTNDKPTLNHHFDIRCGMFSQWTMPGVPMSKPWERKTRELLAAWMASIVMQHWIALDRPSTLNVWRCTTAQDSNKVMCFLDL